MLNPKTAIQYLVYSKRIDPESSAPSSLSLSLKPETETHTAHSSLTTLMVPAVESILNPTNLDLGPPISAIRHSPPPSSN